MESRRRRGHCCSRSSEEIVSHFPGVHPVAFRLKYINQDDYMQVGLDEPVKLRAGDPVGLEED